MGTRTIVTISFAVWLITSVLLICEAKHSIGHLGTIKNIYKITKRLGPHLGPLLGAAAATGMGIVGIGIVHSPMSPFPVPSLPLPPVGQQPVGQVLYYPGYKDKVPKGYHHLPPIQHPAYNNLEYGYYGNVGYYGKINRYKQMMDDSADYGSVSVNDIGYDW